MNTNRKNGWLNLGFSDFSNKLKEKIEKEKKFKQDEFLFADEKLTYEKPKKVNAKKKVKATNNDQQFLKELLNMIENRATGFELAYIVEKNQKSKTLVHRGITFYNTFLNTGNNVFIDLPDKEIKSYENFKTIQETEKYIFLLWLKEEVSEMDKIIDVEKEYVKYEEKIFPNTSQLLYCKNCGAKINSDKQMFCKFCGVKLNPKK